jgi:hypothetical protein
VCHCDVVNLLLFVPIRTTSCLPPSSTYGGSNAVRRRHCILPAARRWHSCWHGVAPSPRRLAPPPPAPARRQPLGDRAKRSPRAPWWRDDNKCTCKCLKARARYLRYYKKYPRAPWWRDDNKCTCKCLKARARYLRYYKKYPRAPWWRDDKK